MANQFVDLDVNALNALTILTITIVSFISLLITLFIFVFCYKYRITPYKFLQIFYDTTIIILTTRSQIVALPSTLRGLALLHE